MARFGYVLAQQPVEADLPGVVREIQQVFAFPQLLPEAMVRLPVQVHVFGIFQHFIQLFKCQFSLQSGKIDIISQNGELQCRKKRVLGCFDAPADARQPFQHEFVGIRLFLTEPVRIQAVILLKKSRRAGGQQGGGGPGHGGIQVKLHQLPGKGRSRGLIPQGTGGGHVAPVVAAVAERIQFDTHTFNFTTILQ